MIRTRFQGSIPAHQDSIALPEEDFARRLAGVDVRMAPVGQLVRTMGAPTTSNLSRHAAELIARRSYGIGIPAEGSSEAQRGTSFRDGSNPTTTVTTRMKAISAQTVRVKWNSSQRRRMSA